MFAEPSITTVRHCCRCGHDWEGAAGAWWGVVCPNCGSTRTITPRMCFDCHEQWTCKTPSPLAVAAWKEAEECDA